MKGTAGIITGGSPPHPIPYQGSKRRLAAVILQHFGGQPRCLIEPFAGSGAVTLAAAQNRRASLFHLNDSLGPLMELWRLIIDRPAQVSAKYREIWEGQHDDPRRYYDVVRDRYDESRDAVDLLFLLARCVKNAVRFNASGDFNQSPDKRRFGTRPERMEKNIHGASRLLRGKTTTTSTDYRDVLERATPADLVYMDPPYQGTSTNRDQRYHQQLDLDSFVAALEELVARGIPFLISFDGRCGHRTYGPELPRYLGRTTISAWTATSVQSARCVPTTPFCRSPPNVLSERTATSRVVKAKRLVSIG